MRPCMYRPGTFFSGIIRPLCATLQPLGDVSVQMCPDPDNYNYAYAFTYCIPRDTIELVRTEGPAQPVSKIASHIKRSSVHHNGAAMR